ncbi:gametocyte-specific factor 1-like isoform X1 [Artemia franciscana]|uniref:gametocyte-specific factor 1-like isoform X1 n=1 Tax=Artemia franciscana TaxID=6661 RepID=UPI0032D9DC9D
MTSRYVHNNDPVVMPNIVCPYDPVHVLYEDRFQRHVVKCAVNHPELAAKMTSCRFNQTHIFLKTEIISHENVCPDRKIALNANPPAEEYAMVRNIAKPLGTVLQCEENWDDEVNETPFDPSKNLSKLQIAPAASGLRKAERKEFKNTARIVLGARQGLGEGIDIPSGNCTLPRLPYQPSAGHQPSASRQKDAAKDTAKPQAPAQLPPAPATVRKPKGKKLAANFDCQSVPSKPSVENPTSLALYSSEINGPKTNFEDEFPTLSA